MNIRTESSQYIKYLLYHSMLFATSEWDTVLSLILCYFTFFDLKTYLYLFTSSVFVSSA